MPDWFQMGELRRCAMGLTSESGRWPNPPLILGDEVVVAGMVWVV